MDEDGISSPGAHLIDEYSTHPDLTPIRSTDGSRISTAGCSNRPKSTPVVTGPQWLRCLYYKKLGESGLGVLVFTAGLIVVTGIFLGLAWERNPERNSCGVASVHREWLFWSILLILAMLMAFWGPRSIGVNQMVAVLQLAIVLWVVVSVNGIIPSESFATFLSIIVVVIAMVILLWVGSTRYPSYTLPPARSILVIGVAILVLSTMMEC